MIAALEEVDGGVCSTSDLGWMSRVLACSFVVRRPPGLREALRRRAAEVADLAERTDGLMWRADAQRDQYWSVFSR